MPTTHDAPPGYALNEALLRARRNGRWLAEQINTSEPHVSRIRNGLRPSPETGKRIADALSKELGRKFTPKDFGWH